jgi:hypothetical protein
MADAGISREGLAEGAYLTTIIVFLAIALYNVVELIFIIFATFRRFSGLYFWSFIVSTWGIALYAVGFLIKDAQLSQENMFYVTLIAFGWCAMVSGQSVVLYSRLHLLLRSQTKLRAVLVMIIVDGIICHIPIVVMVYGANHTVGHEKFVLPYSIYEKVQVTIFFIQEIIISGLYIWEAIKLMRIESGMPNDAQAKRIVRHLVMVNIIIVALDVTILALEYAGMYDIQTAYKALVYSVKLKLEFSILNRLVELTEQAKNGSSFVPSRGDDTPCDFINFDTDGNNRTAKNQSNHDNCQTLGSMGSAKRANTYNTVKAHDLITRRENRKWGDDDLDSVDLGTFGAKYGMGERSVTMTCVERDDSNSDTISNEQSRRSSVKSTGIKQ